MLMVIGLYVSYTRTFVILNFELEKLKNMSVQMLIDFGLEKLKNIFKKFISTSTCIFKELFFYSKW
jgi:hypothetical protein